jgi:type IV pilus assembly protein PilV
MVEVLVALIVICIGLLGIAKMQALALASTNVSRLRALAAIEAASLASSMHVNRAYWAKVLLSSKVDVKGASVTTSDSTLAAELTKVGATGGDYCLSTQSAPCAPATLAAADLKGWATELNQMLPNPTAIIECPTTNTPISCTIQISWRENTVALNAQSDTEGTEDEDTFRDPKYTLYVEP